MRVTTGQMYNTLLTGVQNQLAVQNQGNAQISSGTRFQTPAQAGVDYKVSLDIRHAQVAIKGSLDAIGTAESRLSNSQSMLNNMSNVLKRAQVLAVQMGTTGVGPTERVSAVQQATQLLNQVLNDANQTWQGQSLFAGTAVNKTAFVTDATGKIVYNGNAQDRIVAINEQQQITSNINGNDPAFAAAFSSLESLKTALQNNDAPAIRNALGALTSAGDGMINLTSDVGARLSGLAVNKTAVQDMQTNLRLQLNTHEGVDIPAVVARMQQSSIALQASYKEIAQMKTLNLSNFL